MCCSYGVSGADQQHQDQTSGHPCAEETAGGTYHESRKPGPQGKFFLIEIKRLGLHVWKHKQEDVYELHEA